MTIAIEIPDDQILALILPIIQEQVKMQLEKLVAGHILNYSPTQRLSRNEAAKHLGIKPATLDNWSRAGHVKRHYTPTNAPYFLLGELDGVVMPKIEPRRSARKYERRK